MASAANVERAFAGRAPWNERTLFVLGPWLVGFIAAWTLYASISEAPLAIKHDMLEAYVWGKEFQLGYHQHPPFWAWVCGAWFLVFPRTLWAFALLSSLNAAIGLWGAWSVFGRFADRSSQIASTALLAVTFSYTFLAYKYDANTIFLSLWPWTLYFFLRSVETRAIGLSLAFGLMLGLDFLSKYYSAVFALSLAAGGFLHPGWRAYWRSPAPYAAGLLAAALLAPHVWWLIASGAPPVAYFASTTGRAYAELAGFAWATVSGSLLNLAPAIALAVLCGGTAPRDWATRAGLLWSRPDFRRLLTLAAAPFFFTLVFSFALRTRIDSQMVVADFVLVPLILVEVVGPTDLARFRRLVVRGAVALTLMALAVSPLIAWRALSAGAFRDSLALPEMAQEAARFWREKTGKPMGFVGGVTWVDLGAAFYSPETPRCFVELDQSLGLWATPEAVRKAGLVTICRAGDKACHAAAAAYLTPDAVAETVSLRQRFLGYESTPIVYDFTVIPPHP